MSGDESPLLAAAGMVELVPPVGGKLGGFGARVAPLVGSHDPLHARVVLLQRGAARAIWISCDLLGLSTPLDRALRQQISAALAIPMKGIFVSCTHTHAAPVAMPARGPSGVADFDWLQRGVFDAAVRCALTLPERLRPVREIRTGVSTVAGLAYNRQDADERFDERIFTSTLIGDERLAIATFVNHPLHPVVLGSNNLLCSSDFPGYVCKTVEAHLGGVALFINGACGDVDPVLYRDRGREAGTIDDCRTIGETIGEAAVRSLRSGSRDHASLASESMRIDVPLDPAPPIEEVEALRDEWSAEIAQHGVESPASLGAQFQLAWADDLLDVLRSGDPIPPLSVEVSALRVGTTYALAYPFELYSKIGFELRDWLAPRHLTIAAYTHGLVGYVTTAKAKQQGGYGAALSHRYFPELLVPIGTGADELLVRTGCELIRRLDDASLRK